MRTTWARLIRFHCCAALCLAVGAAESPRGAAAAVAPMRTEPPLTRPSTALGRWPAPHAARLGLGAATFAVGFGAMNQWPSMLPPSLVDN